MSIVSSDSVLDVHQQVGGGRYLIELHTSSDGFVHTIGPYLVQDGFDVAARLAESAARLDQQLADAEATQAIG